MIKISKACFKDSKKDKDYIVRSVIPRALDVVDQSIKGQTCIKTHLL